MSNPFQTTVTVEHLTRITIRNLFNVVIEENQDGHSVFYLHTATHDAFTADAALEQIRLQKIGKHAYVYFRNNGNKLNQVNELIRV
jgi:hypothetical protein